MYQTILTQIKGILKATPFAFVLSGAIEIDSPVYTVFPVKKKAN